MKTGVKVSKLRDMQRRAKRRRLILQLRAGKAVRG